jgi:hypothetical protein
MTSFPRLRLALIGVCVAAMLLPTGSALAAPATPEFGPGIDSPTGYEGQEQCSPKPKPGVVAFQRLVVEAYPQTSAGYISRGCEVGGQSEHKEGRAWDWPVNASNASHREIVDRLFEWLFAEDRFGNDAAMARRLGIMYLIWNKRIWSPWSGWNVYCRMKKGTCRDPEDKGVRHPHTDHVHFSFTWAGANKETSFWHPNQSFVAGIAASVADGYWLAGRNGSVMTTGAAPFLGDKSEDGVSKPVVDVAATAAGDGYWLVTRTGRVFAMGNASYRGSPKSKTRAAGIAPLPAGNGYWIAAKGGRVLSFGKASDLGDVSEQDVSVVDIVSTRTGLGYWLISSTGKVFSFGDAKSFDKDVESDSVVGGTAVGADGLWLVTDNGRVIPLGSANSYGGAADGPSAGSVVAITSTPTGKGYWLATALGRVYAFGDARGLAK